MPAPAAAAPSGAVPARRAPAPPAPVPPAPTPPAPARRAPAMPAPAPRVPSPRAPRDGAPGSLDRFLPAVPEIVGAALVRIDAGLPELASAPWRDRAADEAFLRFELARRLERCAQGVGFDDADLARFAGHFTAMARRGAPLLAVQRFCRAAIIDTSVELWTRAGPADVARLLALSRWLSWHQGAVERLLVRVYEDLSDPDRLSADRRAALAERLLAGLAEPTGEEELELRLAAGYLVVAPAAPVDPSGLPAGTLSTAAGGRPHLLVPVGPDRSAEQAWTEVAGWVAARPGLLAAGAVAAQPARVPSAAAAADGLVGAATAVGLPPGLVGERDLVLETALSARPQGLTRVAAVLDPLDGHPRLVRTLTAFLGNDLDRTRTAEALALSRGGLALRLDRITALTGLDPRSTRGIQVLTTAVTARALLRAAAVEG